MKKRILSIILAICMMITLVPMIGAENNEADINYNGYFICGSELINNGAGNGITSLNRMTKFHPMFMNLRYIMFRPSKTRGLFL